jgi:hypothetical protein
MAKPLGNLVSSALGLVLSMGATGLLACTDEPTPRVGKYWGDAYKQNMAAQIANPNPKPRVEDAGEDGLDSVTAEMVLENYKVDVNRKEEQRRDSFIIETGTE